MLHLRSRIALARRPASRVLLVLAAREVAALALLARGLARKLAPAAAVLVELIAEKAAAWANQVQGALRRLVCVRVVVQRVGGAAAVRLRLRLIRRL